MNRTFKSALYLDDVRTPAVPGMEIVRSYDEFIAFIQKNGAPELISLDHDLAPDQYPSTLEDMAPDATIEYDKYQGKTGYHCAKWLVENKIQVRFWNVHSMNPSGTKNIRELLRVYSPGGEQFLHIPFFLEGELLRK